MKLKNNLLFIITFALFLVNCKDKNSAEKTTKTKFEIPETISIEAQKILENYTLEARNSASVPDLNDLDGWQKAQKKFDSIASIPLPALLKFYNPSIKESIIGGISAVEITPKTYKKNDKLIIYLHGGAFVFFSAKVTLTSSVPLADATGLKIITPNYSLAPQAKYTQILDEIVTFYKAILDMGYNPKDIAIYGDSAGGALVAASLLKLRDANIALPAAAVLWSPWSDIDKIGDSYISLKENDPALIYDNFLDKCALAYAPKEEFKNPYVSPVYGDYTKPFPPTLIQVGEREIFLSNAIRMYRALDSSGKEVELDVYEGMWHVWQGYYEIPESKIAIEKTKKFIYKHLKIE